MAYSDTKIQSEINEATRLYADWRAALSGHSRIHVAVMSEPFLSAVFDGQKTVESRFSVHRVAPYQRIEPKDIVLMKNGPLVGCFEVAWVQFFELEYHPIGRIITEHGTAIGADQTFWDHKASARYATVLGIARVKQLTPLSVSKTDRRTWLSLTM